VLATHYRPNVTDDPDPLPPGFFTEAERRCEFFHENRTEGIRGLAYAVILRALEDGVNQRWLEMLTRFYEVPIPEKYLRRTPERRLRINGCTGHLSADSPRLVLTWVDSPAIRETHLTEVAC